MSLLSSHRLHWGSHHEFTDHFWIIVDHLIHPDSTPPAARPADAPTPHPPAAPADTSDERLDLLGP